MRLTEREVELIEGMIEVQMNHAARALMMNSPMGKRQHDCDMERVELLRRVLTEHTEN